MWIIYRSASTNDGVFIDIKIIIYMKGELLKFPFKGRTLRRHNVIWILHCISLKDILKITISKIP